MKTVFLSLFFLLYSLTDLLSQEDRNSNEFSFLFSNGLSKHVYFKNASGENEKIAYVNSLRTQIAIGQWENLRMVFGLQYGQYGFRIDWVCDLSWDYCQMHGTPPIDVRQVERLHYFSFLFNPRVYLPKNIYIQGGLSLDFPFLTSVHYKYVSSDGMKSKNVDRGVHGWTMLLNTTNGANMILGRKFKLNDKLDGVLELEYKMYNLIAIRFEDYEDYFLNKEQKPWVLGLGWGIVF